MEGKRGVLTQTRPSRGTFAVAFACAVHAGSFSVVLIAGKHVCMFRMCGCKSNRVMKLTTICEVSDVISYTRPSSPLFFSGGNREEGLGRRLQQMHMMA